jgi:hypothetical protein
MYLSVYESTPNLQVKPFYKNSGFRIEDTDTDNEVLEMVIEEFMLRDRQRAEVYRVNQGNNYGFYDY